MQLTAERVAAIAALNSNTHFREVLKALKEARDVYTERALDCPSDQVELWRGHARAYRDLLNSLAVDVRSWNLNLEESEHGG